MWTRFIWFRMLEWNVRSIAGKEIELVGEIKKLNVKILGVTET
jgi:hypothetical protein